MVPMIVDTTVEIAPTCRLFIRELNSLSFS